jgi:Ca2+-binding EF-hand superfamily protein
MKIMLIIAKLLLGLLSTGSEARFQLQVGSPNKDSDDLASEALQHADHGRIEAPVSKDEKDFAALDLNGDGYVSENEVALKQLARASGNERLASRRARDYVSCADSNDDGKIGLNEYKKTVPGVGYTNWYDCVKDKEAPQRAFFAFKEADANHNHQLDTSELHTSFVKYWGTAASDLPTPFLQCCDNDDNGSLSEHEFDGCGGHYNPATGSWELAGSVQWFCLQPALQKYDAKVRFNAIDTNRNHWISKQESFNFLSRMGAEMSHKDADALFDAADVNKDKKIDYVEFQKAGENHNGPTGQSVFFLARDIKFQLQLVEVAWVDPPLLNAEEFRDF